MFDKKDLLGKVEAISITPTIKNSIIGGLSALLLILMTLLFYNNNNTRMPYLLELDDPIDLDSPESRLVRERFSRNLERLRQLQ